MTELELLAAEAVDRFMLASGWTNWRWAPRVYERLLPPLFAVYAKFWIEPDDDGSVVVASELWITCPRVEETLAALGQGDVVATIDMDPAEAAGRDGEARMTVVSPQQLDFAVSGLVELVDAGAEAMTPLGSVDAFVAEASIHPDLVDGASILVPVLLAVAGRCDEARALVAERLRGRPDDDYGVFAARFERWLAGKPVDLPADDEAFVIEVNSADAFREGLRKAREKRARPSAAGEVRPRLSWSDLWRTGRTLVGLHRGRGAAGSVVPKQAEPWHQVELDRPAAEPILKRAREHSSLHVLAETWVEAALERSGTPERMRMRVLVDGSDVGSVSVPAGTPAAKVAGKVEHPSPGDTHLLFVQLPSSQAPTH